MKMINYIMFAEVNDGDNMKRIIEIVEQAISLGEIDLTAKFTSSKVKLLSSSSRSGGGGKKKPTKRHKPSSHEEDLTEENCDENYEDFDDYNDNDYSDNDNNMNSNSNSNSSSSNSNKKKGGSAPKAKASSSSSSKSKSKSSSKGVEKKNDSGSMDDLIAAIQRNRENNGMKSKIDELEKRYASKPSAATSKRK
jgi:hypothetical protein